MNIIKEIHEKISLRSFNSAVELSHYIYKHYGKKHSSHVVSTKLLIMNMKKELNTITKELSQVF
jgi:hypothetical protein